MRMLGTFLLLILSLYGPARAHNFDEYLQSTQLALHGDRVEGALQLHPGNGVADRIIQIVDTDGDRAFTPEEGDAYARRVLGDLALTADGNAVTPQLGSVQMSPFADIEDALGTITITFTAKLPAAGGTRMLSFQNGHVPDLSVYVVTAAAPEGGVEVLAQERDDIQSSLRLTYQRGGPAAHDLDFGNFGAMFRLGADHIAEGTDHLLFLLVLLLPAPLLATGRRWAGAAGLRASLVQIVKIVTAFTVGHSLTLALAALGVVTAPGQPIEILIAVSILISAAHAVQPIFPGREPVVAALFGLIHGLAFAATISLMGLSTAERVGSLFGFNLGIEAMQLLVVAAVMPSLYLLSRTPAYRFVRAPGAFFAAIAAGGWVSERLFGTENVVDALVQAVAGQAMWVAAALFVVSLALWRRAATARGS